MWYIYSLPFNYYAIVLKQLSSSIIFLSFNFFAFVPFPLCFQSESQTILLFYGFFSKITWKIDYISLSVIPLTLLLFYFKWSIIYMLSHLSRVRLSATPQMAAHQAPPSLGFSRQEHWSGLPFPSPMHESEKWKWSRSAVSDAQRPHGLQPTRLLRPWDITTPYIFTGNHIHAMSTQTKKQHITILSAALWNITILSAALWIKKAKLLSCVQLFVTPWTTRLPGRLLLASQAALSMEFSRQKYRSGLPFPSPVDLPDPGIKPGSLHCRQTLYCLSHQGSPIMLWIILFTIILFTLIPRTMKITFTLFLLFSMYTILPQLYFI